MIAASVALALVAAAGCAGGDDDARVIGALTTADVTSTSSDVATVVPESSGPVETTAAPTPESTAPPSPPVEAAALWEDVTETALGVTAAWSNKVELADIDGDGDVDLLFADGGDYESPGTPLVSQVWINDGTGVFADRSTEVLGDVPTLARVIKVRDVNADGLVDIFIGTTYSTQSRLLIGAGGLSSTT